MTRLNLVVAHRLEARPLIELFELVEQEGDSAFKTFANERGVSLVLSGMGKSAAAAATSDLAGRQQDDAEEGSVAAWLNIGIAGHRSLAVGTALRANKIVDAVTGQSYFPPLLLPGPPSSGVVTVAEPELDYPEDVAYDMEAAGFWPAAAASSTGELVQVFKLVSDNPSRSAQRVDARLVRDLFAANRQAIADFCGELQALTAEYNEAHSLPAAYLQLRQSAHFSVTQQHQLRRSCQRARALGLGKQLQALTQRPVGSARQLLAALDRLLCEPVD